MVLAGVTLLGSAVVAGGAVYGVVRMLDHYQDTLADLRAREVVEIELLVAKQDLPLGHTVVPEDLETRRYREEFVPPTAMRDRARVVGRVVAERILANEPLREERLAKPEAGRDINAIIPTGMRAISINISGAAQVAGFVEPGNHVDLIVSTFGDREQEVETSTFLQARRVLAVDDRTSESRDRGVKLKPQVTLQLAPEEAEKLAHAMKAARVRLILRADVDFATTETEGVTTGTLLGSEATRVSVGQWYASKGLEQPSVARTEVILGGEKSVERAPTGP